MPIDPKTTALLLIEYQQRLGQVRIALTQFLSQEGNLSVLTTQAQHRGSRHIGMMNVPCQQTTQGPGIVPRSAATQVVG